MGSREAMKVWVTLRNSLCKALSFGLITLGLYAPTASAKDPSLSAIELYDGASGAAYVQLENVLVNGKTEVRDCTPSGTSPIDKSAYSKFDKLMLAAGGVLERGADGVLRYSAVGGPPICVVPANLKFDHGASLSASLLAENITFRGDLNGPASDGASGAQPLKNGVKLVFIAAPNVELAEFLLAQRAGNIAGWKNYLAKYSAAPHTDPAKDALTGLYVEAGEKALNNYQKSTGLAIPAFSNLIEAKAQEDLAHSLRPEFKSSVQLATEIRGKLQALTDKGRAELDAYNAALTAHSSGYGHLMAAKALAEGIAGVDSQFLPGIQLLDDVTHARNTYESALRSSASASDAKQMDDAFRFVSPYRAFAQEDPRVAQVIDATYRYHYEQGQQADQTQDFEVSVTEFEKARNAKDTSEVQDSLRQARQKFATAQDQAAARAALEKSQNYESQKDFINAFDVLSNLSVAQRAIVSDEIAKLTPDYIQAASDRAKSITKAYPDIKGIEDERQVELAYTLLQSAYKLSDDSAAKAGYQTRIENLAEELSEWFLDRAKHFLEKPAGSFTEIGWTYLKEAESYKAANLEQVRDQRTAAQPAQAMHSKLSILVHFVDQTSMRAGTDFMHQMEDAIITELQKPDYQAIPVRFGETSNGVEPDFHLEGNVLEHELTETPSAISKESHYRITTHQEMNEEWTKANRAYEEARQQLESDQAELNAADKINNKKEVKEISQKMSDDRTLVSNAGAKRDSVPQNKSVDDIRPYQYTQKTIDLKNNIKLQFSIGRAQSGPLWAPDIVGMEEPKQFVLIMDVKPDDTDGVKLIETTPNTQEMQTALGIKVRDQLIEAVGKKVRQLPAAIFEDAKLREQEANLEDAGEAYMRYLSVTKDDKTPERLRAEQFLREQFNFSTFPSAAP
jgi:type IV secretory pathway TrbF-like protein